MESRTNNVNLNEPYRLGDCEIHPATGLVRGAGGTQRLPPQAIRVLTILAGHPGQLLARADIEAEAWEGRVVGYDALTSAMFKLRKALGDTVKPQRVIETVSKRGYRLLVDPVPLHEASGRISNRAPGDRTGRGRARPGPGSYAIAGAAIVAIVLFAIWPGRSYLAPSAGTGEAGRTAIVVLPFGGLDPAGGQNGLADGIADDLTTALTKNRNLLVIARDSAFVYTDSRSAPNIRQIADQLGVDYILRGTIRANGELLHINAQLIAAQSGAHVWAKGFDGKAGEIFAFEEEIIRGIAPALDFEPPMAGSSSPLIVRTSSEKAYQAFELGREHFYLYLNKLENAKARDLFRQALTYDEHFSMARAMLAWTLAFDAMNGWTSDQAKSLQRAYDEAQRVIAEEPTIPLSYFITGLVYRERGEYVKAYVEAEKAIKYDPNYANAHVLLATLLYYAGRPAESIERLKEAIRLNPHHPYNYYFHLGQAYFILRNYDDAITSLQAGIESNPASERLHIWLAATYAQAGMVEDAKWEAEQVRMLNPDFSAPAMARVFPFKDPADRDHFIEGLRKASLTD